MEKKFEELLQELNTIVSELESGELSLEESIEKYQKGMELSKLCKDKLLQAKEVVVKKMNENNEDYSILNIVFWNIILIVNKKKEKYD